MEYTDCLQHLHFQRDTEIEWTGDGRSRGTAARLGLLGDRGHFCTAARLCNSVSRVVLKEKGRISQSNIWGKVPVCCPGSAASLLLHGKSARKGGIGHGCREKAPCRGTGENEHCWKNRGRNENKLIPGERGRDREEAAERSSGAWSCRTSL